MWTGDGRTPNPRLSFAAPSPMASKALSKKMRQLYMHKIVYYFLGHYSFCEYVIIASFLPFSTVIPQVPSYRGWPEWALPTLKNLLHSHPSEVLRTRLSSAHPKRYKAIRPYYNRSNWHLSCQPSYKPFARLSRKTRQRSEVSPGPPGPPGRATPPYDVCVIRIRCC